MLRLVGEALMKNRMDPIHIWWLRFQRDISAAEVPLRCKGSQPQTGIPSPKHQSQEEKAI